MWLRWIVIGTGILEGGWLAFDGTRALVVGDYVTPGSGPYAGRLGPWAKIVAAAGLEPRSTLMKSIHVALGLAWLIAVVAYALAASAWPGILVCAVLSLWYLPFGTILAVVQVAVLLVPKARGG